MGGMGASRTLFTLLFASAALACVSHDTGMIFNKRQQRVGTRSLVGRASSQKVLDYSASFDWSSLDPEAFGLCQNGSQQSPINLQTASGLSTKHKPTFTYPAATAGNMKNWGHGPAFDVIFSPENITSNPSITFDNETNYLVGWHIHTPSDHTINGVHAHAEMHLVHQNVKLNERGIVGILIEPGPTENDFFKQLPANLTKANVNGSDALTRMTLDLSKVLGAVSNMKDFWTYEGSLTTPPCTEGKRWFVSSQILHVSNAQLRTIMGASSFGSRVPQELWDHKVNV